MYPFILFLHGFGRWLVLIGVLGAVLIAFMGWRHHWIFTPFINGWRHWTATVAHLQLLLGVLLYFQSPVVAYAIPDDPNHLVNEHTYFRYLHISLMFIAVVIVTIGSAKAKRVQADQAKFRTMLLWFAAGLLIILIAIPWPFSPLASRPLLRGY
jgi:hypothetical protein